MSGGLLSDLTASARYRAEQAWAEFVDAHASDSRLPSAVWQNDFFGPLPCILAAFCADAVSDTACQQMLEAACTNSAPREDWSGGPHVECPPQCRCGTEAVSTARMELRLWHASWQCANQATLCATDFNNAFGWHVRCRLSNPGLLGDWAVPLPCT